MGRPPCCDEAGVKKGPWTSDEDGKLIVYIQKHGHGSWRALAKQAGLNRCGKSCRLRWTNYLRPGIKRGNFSSQEEQTILTLHSILGNKWSSIAAHLPGRTDNEIKNYWNTRLKKRLLGMGIDPMTHRPRADLLASTLPQLVALTGLTADLIGSYRPWGDYALRAAQPEAAAQLQCLQDHLQSPPSSARTNPSGMSPVSVLGQPFTSVGTTPPRPVNCVTSQIHELPRWQELPPAYDGGIRSVTVSPFAGTLVRPGDDGGSSLIGCLDVYDDPTSFWLAEYTV